MSDDNAMRLEIDLRPTRKIIIHNLVGLTPEQIAKERMTPQGAMPLFWANGVILNQFPLPLTTERATLEFLDGITHWTELHFALMEVKQDNIIIGTEPYGTKVDIVDVSNMPVQAGIANWIKNMIKKPEEMKI